MTRLSDEIIALSDEYVLGLLSPTEAALLEEIMVRDTELAQRVGRLRDRLLPLDLSAEPVELPDGFEQRLSGRLSTEPQLAAIETSRVTAAQPANLPVAPKKWVAGLMAASIAGLVAGIGLGGMQEAPDPKVVAVLVDAAGVPQAVIDDYGNDTAMVRFVADISVPADRTLQVWTLPSADMGPVSLGVLDGVAASRLSFEDLPDPNAEQLYEVTLEPLGGSPTGRPTGPIIGKGFAADQI
ncbi:anti-sigma factor domain-containing protein [Lentibacter sp. XHP0401]|jgi:anti-sigma-K factor RskA|uniref:anti-sigma factor n=1 Tax=Lentibacter sp. XHP0401 TaxID=2984334 RepID=UPI0021E9029A|nr:anti-sigma factor [Lentibacter sp. XHP0401]MCV2891693.1 anti-sigma factor [Lentibacter sp. XHP0401]